MHFTTCFALAGLCWSLVACGSTSTDDVEGPGGPAAGAAGTSGAASSAGAGGTANAAGAGGAASGAGAGGTANAAGAGGTANAAGAGGTASSAGAGGVANAAGASGATSGKFCGGFVGSTCGPTEYCAYVEGQLCGAADAGSTCKPRPSSCSDIYAPVCGCDGMTYASDCNAASAGTGVNTSGECGKK